MRSVKLDDRRSLSPGFSLRGSHARTACQPLNAAFCHAPSHVYAPPWTRQGSLRGEDETAKSASARTGTMQAFRDQLPFTHVFIVLEPTHTRTHTHAQAHADEMCK